VVGRPSKLSAEARTLIADAMEVYVSSASISEASVNAETGKLDVDADALATEIAQRFFGLPVSAKRLISLNSARLGLRTAVELFAILAQYMCCIQRRATCIGLAMQVKLSCLGTHFVRPDPILHLGRLGCPRRGVKPVDAPSQIFALCLFCIPLDFSRSRLNASLICLLRSQPICGQVFQPFSRWTSKSAGSI